MFATKEGERLYLRSWSYNSLLILRELGDLVVKSGGRVQPSKTAMISNRSIDGARQEYTSKLERLSDAEARLSPNPRRTAEIARLQSELAIISSIDNAPVAVPGQSWIRFVLGERLYSLSLDDNFMFDFFYIKTRVKPDGEYSLDACSDVFGKGWLTDNLLSYRCADSDRSLAASAIFDALTHADDTQIILDSKRIRVPNRYDGGFHMETITSKERIGKLDF